jgi:hypothetical protein
MHLAHRLWIGPREGGEPGSDRELLGGTPLVSAGLTAYGDHVALLAWSEDWDGGAVIVVRRSDGLERLLLPEVPVAGLALDGTSLYLATGDYADPERPSLLRYDLSRLEELGASGP